MRPKETNRRGWMWWLLVVIGLMSGWISLGFLHPNDAFAGRDVPPSFSQLAKECSPSVVNVSTVKVIKGRGRGPHPFGGPFGPNDPFKDFFERFFGDQVPRDFRQRSLGTGFIIDKEGHILTNNHVVEGTDEIKVRLSDEKEYDAKIIGRDPKTDLALIKSQRT